MPLCKKGKIALRIKSDTHVFISPHFIYLVQTSSPLLRDPCMWASFPSVGHSIYQSCVVHIIWASLKLRYFLLWIYWVLSDSLRSHGLYPARLLCPWDFPGKDTEVTCHFLLQGMFLTQGSNPRLLHWQAEFFTTEPPGKPPSPIKGKVLSTKLSLLEKAGRKGDDRGGGWMASPTPWTSLSKL